MDALNLESINKAKNSEVKKKIIKKNNSTPLKKCLNIKSKNNSDSDSDRSPKKRKFLYPKEVSYSYSEEENYKNRKKTSYKKSVKSFNIH